jgi:chromosome partitioning protein
VGFFDGLRRNKKAAETIKHDSKSDVKQPETEDADENDAVASSEEESVKIPVPEKSYSEELNTDSAEEVQTEQNQAKAEPKQQASTNQSGYEPGQRVIKSYAEKNPVTHVVGATKIISIINQKGGVGKSTTALNLSFDLAAMGKQVLLVDLDPQGNATSGLGIEKRDLSCCIYDVLLNDLPVTDAILPDIAEGLDLLPATINLAGAEVELVSAIARENRLKDALGSLRGKYDYIFVDCPPSLGLLTVNGLVAADSLLIPIQSEFYALEGVTKLLDSMKLVKSRLNPGLEVFGVLITMYDGRTTLSKQVAQEVRNYFGKDVFETVIPRTVKLSEAPSYGMAIEEYDPAGKGAQAYRDLAKEVITRG